MSSPEGSRLMEIYSLAEHFRCRPSEILDWSQTELNGWRAYFATKGQ